MTVYDEKSILITGGTGTFGKNFANHLLNNHNPEKVIIFSRDEMKQHEMQEKFSDPRLRFFIGDVRDLERLKMAFKGVDLVVHAAATKIVMTAETNPFECIKTNVNGAMNVITAAVEHGVSKVVALSTDKASSPINLYGASKLASDKLFVAGNSYCKRDETVMCVVRYGNVMGSRGSLLRYLKTAENHHKIKLTDERMTRFMISIEQGIDLVTTAFETTLGGEIYVKKIPSMKVVDIIDAIYPEKSVEIIGIRPGEKLHEQMIGMEDSWYSIDCGPHFEILPISTLGTERYESKYSTGLRVPDGFTYTSDNNEVWMTKTELKNWYHKNISFLIE